MVSSVWDSVCLLYDYHDSLLFLFSAGGTSKSSSSTLASKPSSSNSEDDSVSEGDSLEPGLSNNQYMSEPTSAMKHEKFFQLQVGGGILRSGRMSFLDCQGAFCKFCRKSEKTSSKNRWSIDHETIYQLEERYWKNESVLKSDICIQANLAVLAAEGALQVGSVTQQLQKVDRLERRKNREAVKSFICCTHFLEL